MSDSHNEKTNSDKNSRHDRGDSPVTNTAANTVLRELVAHACDGILDASEAAQLADLLRDDPSVREYYIAAMGIETLLSVEHEDSLLRIAQVQQAAIAGLEVEQGAIPSLQRFFQPWVSASNRNRGLSKPSNFTTVSLAQPEEQAMPASRARLNTLFCLAAALLITTAGINGWSWLRYDQKVMQAQRATVINGKPVGRITEVVSARWESPAAVQSNQLVGGQRLRLLEGVAKMTLSHGATVTVEAPAEMEIISGTLMNAHRGTYRATAGSAVDQFVIRTPSAQVVNVGPDIGAPNHRSGVGVEISETGATDVVVFDGNVSLQLAEHSIRQNQEDNGQPPVINYTARRSVRQLGMGEALHIEKTGKVGRIFSVVDTQSFDSANRNSEFVGRVIESVSDVHRYADGSPYYRILPRGFTEDARAFVDRFHEWNGVDGKGLPKGLAEADYVMTFNRDKWASDYAIHVDLAAPAMLYVFMDDRLSPPQWLVDRFQDTGWDIGLDEGWHSNNGKFASLSEEGMLVPTKAQPADFSVRAGSPHVSPKKHSTFIVEHGPGKSIDASFSVWQMRVNRAKRVTLGPPGQPNERTSMYGIAAVRIPEADLMH